MKAAISYTCSCGADYLFSVERNEPAESAEEWRDRIGDVATGIGARIVSVPQDATNGWTYAGYVSNVFAIDYPIPMDQASGYAIELHGSAELMGNDTAKVDFKPQGWQNTAQ